MKKLLSSPKAKLDSPWDTSNILSKIFFIHMYKYFWNVHKKTLSETDLPNCPKVDESEKLSQKLERSWNLELKKRKPRLWRAIIRTFGTEYFWLVLLGGFEEWCIKVIQPLLLAIILRYFEDPVAVPRTRAYWAAAGVCICSMVYTLTHHPYTVTCQHYGMKIRVACMSLIYSKALRLSKHSMGKTTVGQVVNLMSGDANRFEDIAYFFCYVIVAPIQTVIVLIILWDYLGIACVAGIVVIFLFIALQGVIGRLSSKIRRRTALITDERIRLMNEIINGMKIIKLYAWEKSFSEMISEVRKKEVKSIQKALAVKSVVLSLFFMASKVILFFCFVAYVLMDKHLSAEVVFISMALFNTLRITLTSIFPFAITLAAEGLVCCKRIQNLLMLEEKRSPEASSALIKDIHLNVKNLTAWWELGEGKQPCLQSINFNLKPGQLLTVIGEVGSGKSSLLMAVLNEITRVDGQISYNGRLAYSSQEPWCFNGSIRDNILMGNPYIDSKYKDIIHVCALERDLTLFPHGDRTLVGEKGVSLSGGQKARVSLARTLYSDADIYLLDDPLSAVDASVAKHIFDKCIIEYLEKKIRVLVTHQLQFVQSADKILVLEQGKPIAYGAYFELIQSGFDFGKHFGKEEEKEEEKTKGVTEVKAKEVTVDEETDEDGQISGSTPQIAGETKESGSIKGAVFWQYIKAGAGAISLLLTLITTISSQTLFHASDFWLTYWIRSENATYFSKNNETTEISDEYVQMRTTNISVYAVLTIGLFVITFLRATIFFAMCMKSSKILHQTIFYRLMRAPMSLFETNPSGRILNRFSRDLAVVDEQLPSTSFDLNLSMLNNLGVIVVVAIINPYLIIPAVLLAIVVYQLRKLYIPMGRDVKRFEALARSPIYSHVSMTMSGLATIRALNSERLFLRQFSGHLNNHSGVWFVSVFSARALSALMDWISLTYLCVVTVVLMVFSEGLTGENFGLAISSALLLTGMFQWGIRQSVEFENQATSLERVMEYTKLETEAALEGDPATKPPESWPNEGHIVFQSVSLRYSPTSKPVLHNLNFEIKPGEKVGIVGRTGAGKSSLITCLFRLREPDGTIIIDGVDIKIIGLHELRKKLVIIPQEPVLFKGSVRKNLDPFDDYTDEQIWQALEDTQLKEVVRSLEGQLESKISEAGENISVGQRQLFCLARALLRKNKILCIDEATANVDSATDSIIQETIRAKFHDCTVLTIAHRLNTIIDADKVLVMQAGSVGQFGPPYELLQDKEGLFAQLVNQTGDLMARQLNTMARDNYFKEK